MIGSRAPPITAVVRRGHPAEQLLAAVAEGAELLVVGSRGRDGFASLLLGAIGDQRVGPAPCPVVVVPRPAPGAAAT